MIEPHWGFRASALLSLMDCDAVSAILPVFDA